MELKLLEKGVQVILADKFARVVCDQERDSVMRATLIDCIAGALGEVLEEIEYPVNWRRFLKRRDCPQYMKTLNVKKATAYYPKLKLPSEPHYITFDTFLSDLEEIRREEA